MMRPVLFLLCGMVVAGQTPRAVLDLFRDATQALADRQPELFLDCFDEQMNGYTELRRAATALVAAEPASSTVEVVSDEGDDRRREMRIDWLLKPGAAAQRRAILKIVVERRGRGWKITSLDPVAFFAP